MGRPTRRIGVLTGGGDCPGLNAVIRAVVKTAVSHYGWEVVGIEDGFEGLIQPGRTRPLGERDARGLLPRGGTILGTTNRGNPFAYVQPGAQKSEARDMSGQALARIQELGLDGLIVIGGDGSLKIAEEFFRLGAPVVGIPKTIDNDLSATDLTFGFDTAVTTATEAIDKLHTTAESHHRVMVVELMGRSAGWIALASGIAGGADIILIPEIPFTIEKVIEKVRRRDDEGSKFSIVVVAEGAAPKGGKAFLIEGGPPGSSPRFAGIGNWLSGRIAEMTDHEARCTVLGHVQRGGSPSPFDRVLATRFGSAAVSLLAERGVGKMVALRGQAIVSVSLAEAVGVQKLVPPDGELVETARCLGISFGD